MQNDYSLTYIEHAPTDEWIMDKFSGINLVEVIETLDIDDSILLTVVKYTVGLYSENKGTITDNDKEYAMRLCCIAGRERGSS